MSDYDRREGAATGVCKDDPGFLLSTCRCRRRRRRCRIDTDIVHVADPVRGF